jgi:transaldolase
MNTKRETSYKLVEKLAAKKVELNVTALMTLTQVRDVLAALDPNVPSYVCRCSPAVSPIPASIRCR